MFTEDSLVPEWKQVFGEAVPLTSGLPVSEVPFPPMCLTTTLHFFFKTKKIILMLTNEAESGSVNRLFLHKENPSTSNMVFSYFLDFFLLAFLFV